MTDSPAQHMQCMEVWGGSLGLTPAQRELLNLSDMKGEPYCNHWYVMIAGRRV
jgi:hypothetical protein